MRLFILLASSSVLLSGCNLSEKEQELTPPKTHQHQAVQLSKITPQPQNKTVLINDKKFKIQNNFIYNGNSIYDMSVSQFGRAVNQFVVVLKDSDTQLPNLDKAVDIKRIAHNTFKVTVGVQQELLDYYAYLKQHQQFKVVELQVKYGRQSTVIDR